MLQTRGELDLVQEAIRPEHGGQLRMEHLDRHAALVAQVGGQPDHGHSTAAQLALKRVPSL
jgi:hypothetical protein